MLMISVVKKSDSGVIVALFLSAETAGNFLKIGSNANLYEVGRPVYVSITY